MSMKGKKIVLGITGSIAAYKAAILIRGLIKKGAEVQVVTYPRRQRIHHTYHFVCINKQTCYQRVFCPA